MTIENSVDNFNMSAKQNGNFFITNASNVQQFVEGTSSKLGSIYQTIGNGFSEFASEI